MFQMILKGNELRRLCMLAIGLRCEIEYRIQLHPGLQLWQYKPERRLLEPMYNRFHPVVHDHIYQRPKKLVAIARSALQALHDAPDVPDQPPLPFQFAHLISDTVSYFDPMNELGTSCDLSFLNHEDSSDLGTRTAPLSIASSNDSMPGLLSISESSSSLYNRSSMSLSSLGAGDTDSDEAADYNMHSATSARKTHLALILFFANSYGRQQGDVQHVEPSL